MRLVCISAAHTPYNGELMERSAKRVGVEVVRFKEGEPWPNDFRVGKLVHGLECVRSLPEDVTHVMFVDGSDSLFLAGADELMARFEDYCPRSMALVSAERNCYPIAELANSYPSPATPWKYVNSGGWMVRREDAERILSNLITQADYCDQLCWTRAFLLGGPIKLDYDCRIFQSMYLQQAEDFELIPQYNVRMRNLVTGWPPCVLHWNGTRNAGVPFSRDRVWHMIDPTYEVEAPKKIPTIAVCMPGNSFSALWVNGWEDLFVDLLKYFGKVFRARSWGNNIYQVRENCLAECANYGPPDYVLWLDSDNPPHVMGFAQLWAAISQIPEVSAVAAWYRFTDPVNNRSIIAAGKMHGDPYENISEEEILCSKHLIEVPFIGFGMCLMKWQVIEDIGLRKCFEPHIFPSPDPKTGRTWATDDAGFFARAREAGHHIFLHPAVFLEHEKTVNVPATSEQRNEIPVLKEL